MRLGNVSALLANPRDAAVLYYTSDAGVFRTDDGGNTWHAANTGLTELRVSAATISGDALYIGTQTGAIFRTLDGGALWTEVARLSQAIDSVTVDAPHGDLYARTGNKIARSSDDGETWTDIWTPDGTLSGSLAILQGDLYTIAGTTLYVSRDKGVSWSSLVSPAHIFAVDGDSDTIFAGSTGDVIRTVDGGKTWQTLPPPVFPVQLLVAYQDGVVAVGSNTILRYRDGAKSWDYIGQFVNVTRIARAATSPPRVFFVAWQDTQSAAMALFSAADTGGDVQRIAVERGEVAEASEDISLGGSDLYSAACGIEDCESTAGGIAKLAENAADWTHLPIASASVQLTGDVVASAPNTVIAATWDGVHKSSDGGVTWHKVNGHHATDRDQLGRSADGATIYAAFSDGMQKSTDAGESWTSIQSDLSLYPGYYGFEARVAVDPQDAKTVYVSALISATAAGLFKTVDGGTHWIPLPLGPTLATVAIDAFDSSLIYAANGAVQRSQDGGASWQLLRSNCADAVLTDPVRPSTVYVAGCGSVYRSTDGGEHWDVVGGKLPTTIFELAMDPKRDRLFAATLSGVYEYDFASSGATTYAVTLGTYSGNFVSAANCGGRETQSNARFAGPCETFTLIDVNGGELEDGDPVELQAFNGDFIAAENGGASGCGGCGGSLVANRRTPFAWETFTIHKVGGSGPIMDGDNISLQSIAGDYVAAEGGGSNGCQCDSRLNANRAVAGLWETFRVTMAP